LVMGQWSVVGLKDYGQELTNSLLTANDRELTTNHYLISLWSVCLLQ
jgi:hypothetical protein